MLQFPCESVAAARYSAVEFDGAVSRMLRALSHSMPHHRKQDWVQAHISRRMRVSGLWQRTARGLVAGVLHGVSQYAKFMSDVRSSSSRRARWLELRNKIAAYRLFEGRAWAGRAAEEIMIGKLDVYSRMFAAEGYAYRNPGERTMPPQLNLVSLHAGFGVWQAEQALKDIDTGKAEEKALAEFSTVCRQTACEGHSGIMEECFGLVTRTMYPHLMQRIDGCLRANSVFYERFWHGAGRGIYFAPSNLPASRSMPWRGVEMCLRETPQESARHNALTGFCFALTLVNLRVTEVLKGLFEHHPEYAAAWTDGLQAALAVWILCGGEVETIEADFVAQHAERKACDAGCRAEDYFSARPWEWKAIQE